MALLRAVPATSMVDTACEAIREAIRQGRFAGGDRIREVEICSIAKVSRTSVRQALTLLAGEGYVELRPNRGAVVIDWTSDNLLEIFDLRALLEAYAASLAAQRATPAEARAMRQEAERFRDLVSGRGAPDLNRVADSNNRLHRMVLDAARNPRMASLLVAVVHVPLVHQTFGRYDRDELARSAMQHLDLVAAIEAGDPVWADAAMRSHIHAAKQVIFGAKAGADPVPAPLAGRSSWA